MRSVYTVSMRVAAVAFVLLASAVLYKYISVNNQSVYSKQFTGYELNVTRGSEIPDTEAEAYKNKNWSEVISLYRTERVKSNKSIFLAAMAEMQLNHFSNAVGLFESILNTASNDNSFRMNQNIICHLPT